MEIQYHSHIKDRKGVTFIATTNPVYLNLDKSRLVGDIDPKIALELIIL